MSARPVTLLIGVLGGEGGGVLTDWIVAAASQCDLPVQSTSIPGVAQRTGATTYYIEVFPQASRALGGRRPILALSPGIGDIDMVVASELLEAGRAVASGFVTPDRTLVIASTHRFHAMSEKTAMGDGRFDTAKLTGAVQKNAKAHMLFDMSAVAATSRTMINSVMLGAIAASGRLPVPAEAFEAAIRAGKSADANLRGFKAGYKAARGCKVGAVEIEHGASAPSPPS
jgi:indolepyruvate ferredoxin oxidoreductase beta subunit